MNTKLHIPGARALRVTDLPEREPFPPTYLVTIYQEETGEVLNLVCSAECAEAIRSAGDAPLTLEASARQLDLASFGAKGKAYRLRATGVVPAEEVAS